MPPTEIAVCVLTKGIESVEERIWFDDECEVKNCSFPILTEILLINQQVVEWQRTE